MQYGADINHYNMEGCTALSKAVEANHIDVCKYLIECGTDVNHTNNVRRCFEYFFVGLIFLSLCRMADRR